MKGLNRKIIEIVEPNSELVERVIVILKPGVAHASLREEQEQLESYLSAVCCKKKARIWAWIGCIAGVLLMAGLAVWLL